MPKQKQQPESVRSADLASAITRPKGESRALSDTPVVVRFNTDGKSDETRDKKFKDSETCAQTTTVGNNRIYKIKSRRGGKLFNPLVGGYNDLASVDKTSNNPMFQFREVNQKAFESYIRFLQTRFDSYLLAAEREA